jgi:hypothetical protein
MNSSPAAIQRAVELYPETANLYSLRWNSLPKDLHLVRSGKPGEEEREEVFFKPVKNSTLVNPTIENIRRGLLRLVIDGLKQAGYTVSRRTNHGNAKVIQTETNYGPGGSKLCIYPSFKFRVLQFEGRYYLCVDHRLTVRAELSLEALFTKSRTLALNPAQRVLIKVNDDWQEGRWVKRQEGDCILRLLNEDEIIVPAKKVYPELTRGQIQQVALGLNIKPNDLERSIKQYSFLTVSRAPLARLSACNDFAAQIAENVFPVSEGNTEVRMSAAPATLKPPIFNVSNDLREPSVCFDHVDKSKRGKDILQNLVQFGSYDKPAGKIRLALLTPHSHRPMMERLVKQLNVGSARYRGAAATFGTEFEIRDSLSCKEIGDYEEYIRKFVRSDERKETDVALVYMPKGSGVSDSSHPYYKAKSLLLREGIVSQMVDTATVLDPKWRDLNLALNIFAKAGHTPWVLDDPIPNVSLFIGLSYSQKTGPNGVSRMMGYVNIFDAYGRWRFYQGDTAAFSFENRLAHYEDLVKNSIAAYSAKNKGEIKTVHIHLTKHFSRRERAVLAEGVRSVAKDAVVIFVSLNPYHLLRLYDVSEGGDGRIKRATYLQSDETRFYLTTTGNNIYDQKSMGTPIPLEVTVWADPVERTPSPKEIAQQILSLTRLNWASSKNFCHEPITTKYAGEIARQMTAFMDDPTFSIGANLRGTPWFL